MRRDLDLPPQVNVRLGYLLKRAQLELAELLTRSGLSSEARAQAEQAHVTFTGLGATPWAERASVTASLASV
jgi:hypothetical protein